MDPLSMLPFQLEALAISKWVDALPLNQPVQAANDIHSVLRTLINNPEHYQSHIEIILAELSPVAVQLSLNLEPLFASQAEDLGAKKRKIAHLSTYLLRYQALLYFQLSASIDKDKLGICINRCIQICYLYFKQSALIYELPAREIWKVLGKMYHLAGMKGLFDSKLKDSIPLFKKQSCIINSIKATLLFSLCRPYYLSQNEISSLSSLCEHYSSKLILTNLYSTMHLHCWRYEQADGIQIITHNAPTGSSTIFLDINLIPPILRSKNFSFLAEKLTAYRDLRPVLTEAAAHTANVAYQLKNIINTMEKPNRRPTNINTTTRKLLSLSDKLELQPFDYDYGAPIKKTNSEDIWQTTTKPKLAANEVLIKDNHTLNYALIESANLPEETDNLVFTYDKGKIQLGIIRHISMLKQDTHQLFIEKINATIKVVTFLYAQSDYQAIHCKVSDALSFILVSSKNKYKTGSTIHINSQTFTLSRLLENTPSFNIYQIHLDLTPHEEHAP